MNDDSASPGPPPLDPAVLALGRSVREAGGRAYVVGGWVRDLALLREAGKPGPPAALNYDLEVFGLTAARLLPILEQQGAVHLVGESFAVYKVVPRAAAGSDASPGLDVSLPRRDVKVGRGHRGFAIREDPALPVREAARRRDFTVNAMLLDPLTGETIDPWGGLDDLRARRLRAVDPRTFVEDSLRVLRALQLASRLGFDIDPQTADLCRGIDLADLPAERIRGEMEKLLLAPRPSIGLDWALRLGVVDRLFPELRALVGCRQDPEWHPEGDVWVHTLLAIDRAAHEVDGLPREKQLAVLLAVLCHDLGKPSTTEEVDGRVRSFDHEAAGVEPAGRLLDRLKIHTLGGYDLRGQVLALVKHHLAPSHFHKNRDEVGDGAFRRLAGRLEPELLYRVARADCLGRTGEFSTEAQEWFIERARALGVEERPPRPILMGRHLLEMGLEPGPEIGRIVRAVYEMQLDGRVADLQAALDAARRLLSGGENG
jgi:tRNA nucleotidyltransferase (CCA-adding enzyme)